MREASNRMRRGMAEERWIKKVAALCERFMRDPDNQVSYRITPETQKYVEGKKHTKYIAHYDEFEIAGEEDKISEDELKRMSESADPKNELEAYLEYIYDEDMLEYKKTVADGICSYIETLPEFERGLKGRLIPQNDQHWMEDKVRNYVMDENNFDVLPDTDFFVKKYYKELELPEPVQQEDIEYKSPKEIYTLKQQNGEKR